MENELKQVIELFLTKNNIHFNKDELKLQLLTHPYYPSVNAITDLFDHFHIENVAAELPIEETIITELPNTFLAHIKEDNIEKIVLIKKGTDSLKIIYGKNNTKVISPQKFIAIWTGVVIAVENEKKAPTSMTSGFWLKSGIYLLLLAVSLYSFSTANLSLKIGAYIILSFLGIYIGVLLIQKELGVRSKILDKFCEGSPKSSCYDILNSKGASVLGLFKLSDVGIVYFSGLSLALLLFIISSISIDLNLFYFISFASALFIPYSVYYQWKVVQKWCPLCLAVLAILLLQMVVLFNNQIPTYSLNTNNILIVLFSFLFMTAIWSFMKPLLKKQQEFEVLQLEYYKFKRNNNLFTTALKSSKVVNTKIYGVEEITFGNENASIQIVLITNPLCSFCKESHKIIHEILMRHPKNIHLITRFNINTVTTQENNGLLISNKLIEIYASKGSVACINALNEVYSDTNPGKWVKKNIPTKNLKHFKILEKEKEWCTNNGINFTPAVFINGYLYPKEYNIADLPFFIDSLIEQNS